MNFCSVSAITPSFSRAFSDDIIFCSGISIFETISLSSSSVSVWRPSSFCTAAQCAS